MAGAVKAAPRLKAVELAPDQYEVLVPSFIGNTLRQPGEIVQLPVGTDACSNLRKIVREKTAEEIAAEKEAAKAAKAAAKAEAEAKAKAEAEAEGAANSADQPGA